MIEQNPTLDVDPFEDIASHTLSELWCQIFVVANRPFEDATDYEQEIHRSLQRRLDLVGQDGMRCLMVSVLEGYLEMEWATEGFNHEWVAIHYMKRYVNHAVRFNQMFQVFVNLTRATNTWIKEDLRKMHEENIYD